MQITKKNAVAAALMLTIVSSLMIDAQTSYKKEDAVISWYGDEFHGKPTSSGEIFDMNAFTAAHKTLPFGTMLEVTNLANGKKTIVRVNDRGPFVDDRELDVSKAAAQALDMITSGTTKASIAATGGAAPAAVSAAVPAAAAAPAASPAPAPAPAAASGKASEEFPTMKVVEAQPQPDVNAGAMAEVRNDGNTSVKASATVEIGAPVLTKNATGVAWRIQLGSFTREENATRLVSKLRADGFSPAFEKTGTMTRVVLAAVPDADLAAVKDKLAKAGYRDYLVRQESW